MDSLNVLFGGVRGHGIITEIRAIVPVAVSLGGTPYPEEDVFVPQMRSQVKTVCPVPATEIAETIELTQAANMVLSGTAIRTDLILPELAAIRETLVRTLPARTLDLNLKALEEGFDVIPVTQAIDRKTIRQGGW
ncbi:MAG: 2-oxoacid:acceptor oxidoreductase family protein [Candidatus Cryosericum sp.]|nr:2-oxoacid:acceptor oxidoreductase family protein [bacterium]